MKKMKISDVSAAGNFSNAPVSDGADNEQKVREVFKTLFMEKMISEMFKTTKLFSGDNQVRNDFYEQQLAEALSEQLMKSSDIRWDQIFKSMLPAEEAKNE